MSQPVIVQIGAIPPPFGGVAIHIRRLHHQLHAKGWRSEVWDFSSQRKSNSFVKMFQWPMLPFHLISNLRRDTIYHLHGNNFYMLFWLSLFSRLSGKFRFVWTLHNIRLDEESKANWWISGVALALVPSRTPIVAVSPAGLDQLRRKNWINPLHQLTAYICPEPDELIKGLPEIIEKFIQGRRPLLVNVVSEIIPRDGGDLYGLDMMPRLARRLKDEFGHFALVIIKLRPSRFDETALTLFHQELQELGVADCVFLYDGALEHPLPLIKRADVFLRPTRTDGTSVALLEALELGVASVASDCTGRHEAAILFKTGDQRDFEEKVLAALRSNAPHPQAKPEDCTQQLIEIYKSLC